MPEEDCNRNVANQICYKLLSSSQI